MVSGEGPELLAQAGIDAQASNLAAKLQEIVIGELHHRVKNTLAIVSAITSQSLKTATPRDHLGRSRLAAGGYKTRFYNLCFRTAACSQTRGG
jgi:hypothetical protein